MFIKVVFDIMKVQKRLCMKGVHMKMPKKILVSITCFVALVAFSVGCGQSENITTESISETESVFNEVVAESITDQDAETESVSEAVSEHVEEQAETSSMVYYEDISFGTLVEDEAMLQRAKSHIVESNKIYTELLVSYPIDQNQSIVIDDMPYYLVNIEGCTGWDYYENRALEFYTEEYVKEVFTPYYYEEKNLYKEYEGKLYRVMADGFGSRINEDSIKLWHLFEDIYVISYLGDIATVVEQVPEVEVLTVRLNEEKKYGFESITYVDRK